MIVIQMTNEEKIALLSQYADYMRIDVEKLLALYTFYGDDVFLFFYILSGDHVRFPTENILKSCHSLISKCKLIRVNKPIKKGDMLTDRFIAMKNSWNVFGSELVLAKQVK